MIITFTEAMRTNTVVHTIEPAVVGWLSWEPDDRIARFDHLDFQVGETYTFSVASGRDVAGNPIAEPLQLVFTTQERYQIYLPLVLNNN